MTRYCVAEINHHVLGATDGQPELADIEWLTDIPMDCIAFATSAVYGLDGTVAAAADFEANGDYWRAACFRALAAQLCAVAADRGPAGEHWGAALLLIDKVRTLPLPCVPLRRRQTMPMCVLRFHGLHG